ncbi:MAG: MurR/RpiR family transcriptional regulator [Acidimicrobiales bacterium]|nr:MurR/RpiR family transcriptional regulator [Acidimicrobiales bacterium]
MDVGGLIRERLDRCTPAERRVAEVVLRHPQLVAFGTVAQVAERATTSGSSVVRLAARLGFDGFRALQEQVQAELASRLRPATERIRLPAAGDVLGRALATELDNVQGTLDAVDRHRFDRAVGLLADLDRPLLVLAGDASRGVGTQVSTELSMLRSEVIQVGGDPVAVARLLAGVGPGPVVLAVDLGRYDRWLVDAVALLIGEGASVVALSDSPLSPLGRSTDLHFDVVAEGAGPFDSYVGALALLGALVAAVAERLRATATGSLDRVEAAWRETGALFDG